MKPVGMCWKLQPVRYSSPPYTTSTSRLTRSSLPTAQRYPSTESAEDLVEQPEEPAEAEVQEPGERVDVFVALLQQDRAQGRAERQRVEGRDDRGNGDGQGELAEELAGDSRDEHARDEHRGEHQPDGDHRRRDLGHGLVGGGARRHALLDVVLRGLDHHDGVVDHDADGQHQPEQAKAC